jgi:predicted RNA-binding protein with PIN domain
MTRPRLWIVDGHNVIFQLPFLEELQTSGRKREARELLEMHLLDMARRLGERVQVVYDGNRMEANPDARREVLLETFYTCPPEQADDRIVFLACKGQREGFRVVVVTDDVHTLAPHLPSDTHRMGVAAFAERFLRTPAPPPEKPSAGDFQDVEEALRERAREMPAVDTRGPTASAPTAAQEPPRRPARPSAPPQAPLRCPPMSPEAREALRRKKERGRRRQERRLRRSRRRKG